MSREQSVGATANERSCKTTLGIVGGAQTKVKCPDCKGTGKERREQWLG